MPLRDEFPASGQGYLGGTSDGFVYTTFFAGGTLADSYAMIVQFLKEEGYSDIPVPNDFEELQKFRIKTRNRQIIMYEENGYVHNPIKILFPTDSRKKRVLILFVFNENAPNHLLRFHRKL